MFPTWWLSSLKELQKCIPQLFCKPSFLQKPYCYVKKKTKKKREFKFRDSPKCKILMPDWVWEVNKLSMEKNEAHTSSWTITCIVCIVIHNSTLRKVQSVVLQLHTAPQNDVATKDVRKQCGQAGQHISPKMAWLPTLLFRYWSVRGKSTPAAGPAGPPPWKQEKARLVLELGESS